MIRIAMEKSHLVTFWRFWGTWLDNISLNNRERSDFWFSALYVGICWPFTITFLVIYHRMQVFTRGETLEFLLFDFVNWNWFWELDVSRINHVDYKIGYKKSIRKFIELYLDMLEYNGHVSFHFHLPYSVLIT